MGNPDFCCTLQQRLPAELRYRGRGVVAWPPCVLELIGINAPHAAFREESRIRGRVWSRVRKSWVMAAHPAVACRLRPASSAQIAATNQPLCYFLGGAMVSLAALDTRNLTTVLALILMVSPVCGLRPMRAFRSAFTNRPSPGMTNTPFFFVSFTAVSASRSRNAADCLLVSSSFSASVRTSAVLVKPVAIFVFLLSFCYFMGPGRGVSASLRIHVLLARFPWSSGNPVFMR